MKPDRGGAPGQPGYLEMQSAMCGHWMRGSSSPSKVLLNPLNLLPVRGTVSTHPFSVASPALLA